MRRALVQRVIHAQLERVHLLKLDVDQLVDEARLIMFGPFVLCGLGLRRSGGRIVGIRDLTQQLLELGVVDVVVPPRRVDGGLEGLSEAHCDDAFGEEVVVVVVDERCRVP